jgi:hypothetical protein
MRISMHMSGVSGNRTSLSKFMVCVMGRFIFKNNGIEFAGTSPPPSWDVNLNGNVRLCGRLDGLTSRHADLAGLVEPK